MTKREGDVNTECAKCRRLHGDAAIAFERSYRELGAVAIDPKRYWDVTEWLIEASHARGHKKRFNLKFGRVGTKRYSEAMLAGMNKILAMQGVVAPKPENSKDGK